MNKTISLALILLASAFHTLAQEKDEIKVPRTFIKVSPHVVTNTIQFGLERLDSSLTRSFQVSIGYRDQSLRWNPPFPGHGYEDGTGTHLEFSYRNYIEPFRLASEDLFAGVYYSFSLKGATFKGTANDFFYNQRTGEITENRMVKVFSVTPAFTIGFQHQLWKVVGVEVFLGSGFRFVNLDSLGEIQQQSSPFGASDPTEGGMFMKAGINVCVGL
jgi:hypothetical protein